MSPELPSWWRGGQPLRVVPGCSFKGGGKAGTSSTETSSNSGSELSGSQGREGEWGLRFLRPGAGKGWRFRALGVGEG